MSRWRQIAEQTIREVIAECTIPVTALTTAEIRQMIDAAYPFGERAYHPYKIWLHVRRQAFLRHGLLTEEEKARLKAMPDPEKRHKSKRAEDAEWLKAQESGLIS